MSTKNTHPGASAYRDRHGKIRWRFRRVGLSVTLKGHPGDPEFENAYKAARDGIRPRRAQQWLRTGIIYVIQGEPGTPVKIGFTGNADVSRRLAELQIGSASDLRVIVEAPAYRQHERLFHVALADDRIRGEWFAWSPKVREFVEALAVGIVAALDRTLPPKLLGEPALGEPLATPPLSL